MSYFWNYPVSIFRVLATKTFGKRTIEKVREYHDYSSGFGYFWRQKYS